MDNENPEIINEKFDNFDNIEDNENNIQAIDENFDNNIQAIDLFNTISHEISRIYKTVNKDIQLDDQNNTKTSEMEFIRETINALQEGEETLLLRICTGKASEDEIEEWISEQNIDESERDEIISMLQKSYAQGEEVAKNMVNKNLDHENVKTTDKCQCNVELKNEMEEIQSQLCAINRKLDLILDRISFL